MNDKAYERSELFGIHMLRTEPKDEVCIESDQIFAKTSPETIKLRNSLN